MPHKNSAVHDEPLPGPLKPVAEFNILYHRCKMLGKPAALFKEIAANYHCVGSDIVRFTFLELRTIDEYGLKGAEKGVVKGDRGVGAADDYVPILIIGIDRMQDRIILNNAVHINEEEGITETISCAGIPCH